ncbi:hypothetical protein TWF718_008404 [Orbilia javanica]|uniref:Uncharacterized protein n=1 Tax=Orbilia javanica TaxID=47235 RepID=A0AAN8MQ87_9PEZI
MTGSMAHNRAREVYRRCMDCLCTSEGKMIPSMRPRPKTGGKGFVCRTAVAIAKCLQWYECRCEARMRQPEPDPEIPVEEYQDALNNIPLDIKMANSRYAWKYSQDKSLQWQYVYEPEAGGSGQSRRYLVPGTKEPYYLEGPDPKFHLGMIPEPLRGLTPKLGEFSTVDLGYSGGLSGNLMQED